MGQVELVFLPKIANVLWGCRVSLGHSKGLQRGASGT